MTFNLFDVEGANYTVKTIKTTTVYTVELDITDSVQKFRTEIIEIVGRDS